MTYIKTGRAPNLPWWRIQNMSDEEIEKYNDSFMMIERLPEEAIGKPLKIVGIEKAKEPSIFEREIWNAAIEAAANIAEEWANGTASEIRKLRK